MGEEELEKLFGLDLKKLGGPVDVYWKGVLVKTAYDLRTQETDLAFHDGLIQEVVWDLYEHNFRLELLALDRCVIPRDGLNEASILARDYLVSDCFPRREFIFADFPKKDVGLGAKNWEDRKEYVEAFRVLLSAWPGEAGRDLGHMVAGRHSRPNLFEAKETDVLNVEHIAYPFYCQTFFDYFGRAPTLPHQLPPRF